METHVLKLILFNMKTGNATAHEVSLTPTSESEQYKAYLLHTLFHRVESHFGRGPFTTAFTLTHGPFVLHGSIKSNHEMQVQVIFDEAD